MAYVPAIQMFEEPANYLSVHSYIEAFTCAVSVLTFAIGWHAARVERSGHLAVLAVAFLAVALLDLAHLLSYPGMPDFVTTASAQKAIDFWLAARFAQALGLFGFAALPWTWRIGRLGRIGFLAVSLGYTAVAYCAVLMVPDVLPETFLPTAGLTQFKVDAEYGVIALQLLAGAILLTRQPGRQDIAVPLLVAAILVLGASGMAVTRYHTTNDNDILLGHIYKFIGFWLIFRAVFVRGIQQPHRDRVASERLYRRLTEQAADAIMQLDRSGLIVNANPQSEMLTGSSADRLRGARLSDFLAGPADHHLADCRSGRSIQPAIFESIVTRLDGDRVPVEISISRLDDGGCLAIARDISERKRSDRAIRIRDIAFASSVVPLVMANLDGVVSYVNRGFIALLGYDREQDFLGRPFQDFVLNPHLVSANIGRLKREGQFSGDLRCMRRDGSVIVTQVSANIVYDEAGDPICMIGSFKDVTEQLATMQALKESEQRFSSFFNEAPAGMAIFDPTGRWTHLNPVLSRRMSEPHVGRFPSDVLSPEVATPVEASIRKVATTGRSNVNLEVTGTLLSDPGVKRRWLVSHFPLLDNDGAVAAVGSVVIETTALAEIENQLRQGQRLEALGKLTGGLAHDSNNYLGVIIGNLDLLREMKADDPEAVPLIDDALAAALRGADLTRSLLAFARRQPLNPQRVDLNARIEVVTNLLRRTLGEDVTIKCCFSPGLWPVRIDGAQLDSCIINLANNARDAMPSGGTLMLSTENVRLDNDFVRMSPGSEAGDYVMMEVLDNGAGMTPDTAARAFEPFFTTKGPGAGTGLGLSMVHGFVKQSGGYIKIDSEIGRGTRVRIYLPPVHSAEGTIASSGADPILPNGTATILMVEDNAPMRKIVATQLRTLGYAVVEATNGAEAMAILDRRGQPLDLLFTDIVMPGRPDGVELARQAKNVRPLLKVLLTTGFSDDLVNAHHARGPEMKLLRKPYRRDELARAIQDALAETAVGQSGLR
jgi:PAS domain S-box-containing protein